MLEPPASLLCLEYRGRAGAGMTRPLLVQAVDELTGERRKIVLKLKNPEGSQHAGPTSLACELICAVLARRVGLPVADYAIVRVPGQLPDAVPDAGVRDLLRRNLGLHFGTVYMEGAVTWNPPGKITPDWLVDGLEDLLGFDQVVMNGDRKASNSNVLWRGTDWFLIDHSLALLTWLWTEDHPLFPEEQVKEHCSYRILRSQGKDYQRFHQRWATEIQPTELARLRAMIPPEWETAPGQLDGIFAFLGRHSTRFADLINHLKGVVR